MKFSFLIVVLFSLSAFQSQAKTFRVTEDGNAWFVEGELLEIARKHKKNLTVMKFILERSGILEYLLRTSDEVRQARIEALDKRNAIVLQYPLTDSQFYALGTFFENLKKDQSTYKDKINRDPLMAALRKVLSFQVRYFGSYRNLPDDYDGLLDGLIINKILGLKTGSDIPLEPPMKEEKTKDDITVRIAYEEFLNLAPYSALQDVDMLFHLPVGAFFETTTGQTLLTEFKKPFTLFKSQCEQWQSLREVSIQVQQSSRSAHQAYEQFCCPLSKIPELKKLSDMINIPRGNETIIDECRGKNHVEETVKNTSILKELTETLKHHLGIPSESN